MYGSEILDEIKEIVKGKNVNKLIDLLCFEPIPYALSHEVVRKLVVKWLKLKVNELEKNEDNLWDYVKNYDVAFSLPTIFDELAKILERLSNGE